jgi:hypothetical protein
MRSVADDLRGNTGERVLQLPVLARIELALALGRDDLRLYVQASGLSPDEARRDLVAQRRQGRQPSYAAESEP